MKPPSSTERARVLFVSLHNSARSLMAEALLNKLAPPGFTVYSCGVPGYVADAPDPGVVDALARAGLFSMDLHPKSWTHLQQSGVRQLDFVITLSDPLPMDMPIWQGRPIQATWAYPLVCGPALSAADSAAAIQHTLYSLHRRIELFVSLHRRVGATSALADDLRSLGWE